MTGRAKYCLGILNACKNVKGDIVELGVGAGTTTTQLGKFIRRNKINKKIYAFDTFKGHPYTESKQLYKGRKYGGSLEKFKLKLKSNKLENTIIPVKGKIEDTLNICREKQFCFIWFDLDLYKSTSFAYNYMENKVSIHGSIGFHDYRFKRTPGIKKVVDSELDNNKFIRIFQRGNSVFFKKETT